MSERLACACACGYDECMPNVELQRALTVPAVPSRAALSSILHEIADGSGRWADFALYATLGDLGLPDVGYVGVPVRLFDLSEQVEPRHEIRFKLEARRRSEAFPAFIGATGIEANGPSTAEMWLAGTYEVPLHLLGGIMNQTVLRGMAEKSLANMTDELASAVVAHVEQREIEASRYRLLFKAGD
jgi:hypothetical protein